MTLRNKTIIELSCNGKTCNKTQNVENHCRPFGWAFVTFQNDTFLSPLNLHFCPTCAFTLRFPADLKAARKKEDSE